MSRKITIRPDGFVLIDFERSDGKYTIRDCIWLTKAQYEAMTSDDIAAIEQQRWDDWLKIVTTPPIFDNHQLDENGNVVVDETGAPVILENNNG